MKKIYTLALLFLTFSIANAQILFNEVCYDPSNDTTSMGLPLGDTNGDGTYDQSEDEFIEIYNSNATSFDISGYQVVDDTTTGTVRYTFPNGTMIPARGALVLFGDALPVGNFGGAVVLADTAGVGLSLNNSGEVIGILDTSGNVVIFFDSDALSDNPNESYTRFPDVTGAFLQHGDTTPVLFSPGTRTDGSPFITPNPLIINEVLYDPSNSSLDGDANGDGIYSQDDDSFIEIYNSDSSAFDISGYEIWDDTASGGSIQYRFPPNTTIPGKEVVVVFGGGTATGSFGTSVVLVGDSGLNFNNSGEVIGIKDSSGNWSLIFDSDALSNNPNESYTRFPDITGDFLQHEDTTTVLFSPGTKTDGTSFRSTTGLREIQNQIDLKLYPNPVSSILNLKTKEKIQQVEIFNLQGIKIKSDFNLDNTIDVSDLPNGIYLLRMFSLEGVKTSRFIKQ